jgi:hypothetical protein
VFSIYHLDAGGRASAVIPHESKTVAYPLFVLFYRGKIRQLKKNRRFCPTQLDDFDENVDQTGIANPHFQ